MTKDEFNQDYDRITKTAPVEDMMRQQKKLMSLYIDSLETQIAELEAEKKSALDDEQLALKLYDTELDVSAKRGKEIKKLEKRIDIAIKLIQNDQAFTAMRLLMGQCNELLDTNPLKDYPADQLNEKGYRKFFD